MKDFLVNWFAPAFVALVVSLAYGFVQTAMHYKAYLHEHEVILYRIEQLEQREDG